MKPAFSYYGGKFRLARRIVEMMPPHTVYVEPFCGSAAVMFAKPVPPVGDNNYYREVINDRNEAVVSIFRAMREHPEEFKRRVELMPYSQAEHERAWAVYRGEESEPNEVEKAALLMLLFSGAFSGKPGSTQANERAGGNSASTWAYKRESIGQFNARMQRVYVQKMDAVECIKKWDSPQTLFYCDPPYVGTHCGHYGSYTEDDLDNLLLALDAAEGAFILSGYANEVIDGLGAACEWGRKEWQASSSAARGKNRKRTEVVWFRPRRGEPTSKHAAQGLLKVEETNTFTGDLSRHA